MPVSLHLIALLTPISSFIRGHVWSWADRGARPRDNKQLLIICGGETMSTHPLRWWRFQTTASGKPHLDELPCREAEGSNL